MKKPTTRASQRVLGAGRTKGSGGGKETAKAKKRKLSRARKPEDMTLDQWQVALRREFGREQSFGLENIGDHPVFSEFLVTNPETERTYRVAIRGEGLGVNYCSCPDFSVNALGTCKHVEFTLARLRRRASHRKALAEGYVPAFSEVYLRYGPQRRAVFSPGTAAPQGLKRLAAQYFDEAGILRENAVDRFDAFLKQARRFDHDLRCYPDALVFIAEAHDANRRRAAIEARYGNGQGQRGTARLLKTALYPYQREGALFAAQAGRSLIADDMGLGKTVQAIAAIEIMAKEFGVERVLVVCPTSLKYQWKNEIERFSDRQALVIEGPAHVRKQLYARPADFKIVNYELVFRDQEHIESLAPDVVILDEAQRIKNWQTRTAQSVKRIQSPYALVLTGTPLENRLAELHSIVEFIDRHRLGPLFRFLANHQIPDPETGRVVGYRNLKSIGETLAPILLRRTKDKVLQQLPERMDKTFFVPMTQEQWIPHNDNREIVARIVAKWRRYKFLSEVDQRRLTIALQYMRMACDNTYLVDKETKFGPKLDELMTLLDEIFEQPDAKTVIFSQWQRMNDLVAQELQARDRPYVYLHGSVPGPKRRDLIKAFQDDPKVRAFLSTDAGGIGLNLQAASTVINLDLPWNPAVLEQRIGRVHRIGQRRPVRVVNFVSQGTIEHGMIQVLKFKKSLFSGVLDGGDDSVLLGGTRLKKLIETVETVTEAVPETAHEPPPSEPEREEEAAAEPERPAPLSSLQPLLESGAAFLRELGALAAQTQRPDAPGLASLVETDHQTGRSYLKVPMPDPKTIENVAGALAPLLDMLKPK